MDLQSLANLGEFVGAIAVVISLVYLALQVRQQNRSLRTENYARALDRIAAIQSGLGRDSELSRLLAKGVADASRLSPPERIQLTWWFYETFGAFEFMFHAAQNRALPDEVWERWSAIVGWWLGFPGVRTWWRGRPTPFTPGFTAFVERLLREGIADPEAAARWSDFVAGRGPQIGGDAPVA